MSDILDGLDMPEAEATTPEPQAPEPQFDPSPPAEQPRAKDGTFKGEGRNETQEKTEKPERQEKPETIPIARHLEERNKFRAELEQERAARKALEERLAKLENPPKQQPAEPDFTTDPKGYVDTKLEVALKRLETDVTEGKKTAEQAQQEAAFTRFQHQLTATEQQFIQQNADYYDALRHLRELRFQELAILNPGADEQRIIDAIKQEEVQLAWQHMAAGRNPHQVAYALARARGYAPKQANGAAGSVLPNVPGPKQLPPDQTLGSGSGTPNAGESFLDDDEAFDRAFSEMFGRKRA